MEIKSSELREVIQLLSGSGRGNPQVVAPVLSSETEPVPGHEKESASGISLLTTLSYHSKLGDIKNQDILIRRIVHTKDDLYIDGVIVDIQAPRLIKVGNITEIRDIGSGRIYTNPYEFIQNRLGVAVAGQGEVTLSDNVPTPTDDFSKVIDRMGLEITILMYLSSLDGVRRKEERQKVIDYIKERTKDLNYNEQDLNEYLISVVPDEESCTLALAQVINKGKGSVQGLMETVVKVILADNQVNSRERQFLIRMMDLLESEGYEFNLPV